MKNSAKPLLTTSIVRLAIESTGRTSLHPETTTWKARLASAGAHISKPDLRRADRLIKALYKTELRDCFTRLSLFDGRSTLECTVPLFFNQSGSPEPEEAGRNQIITGGTAEQSGDIYTLLPMNQAFLLINTGRAFFLHYCGTEYPPPLYTASALDETAPGRVRLSGISFGRKLNLKEEKDFRAAINSFFSSKGESR